MLALCVPQPWAWAIARGHKTHLNRATDTGYRGPLAIYASSRAETTYVRSQAVREATGDSADPVAAIGGIVAVVSLAGVCTAGISGRARGRRRRHRRRGQPGGRLHGGNLGPAVRLRPVGFRRLLPLAGRGSAAAAAA